MINVVLVALLTGQGVNYLLASAIASEATIVGNFILLERFVFRDLVATARPRAHRFLAPFLFNNAEAVVRLWGTYILVSGAGWNPVLTTAVTLATAFLVRFCYPSLLVYRAPGPKAPKYLDSAVSDDSVTTRD